MIPTLEKGECCEFQIGEQCNFLPRKNAVGEEVVTSPESSLRPLSEHP